MTSHPEQAPAHDRSQPPSLDALAAELRQAAADAHMLASQPSPGTELTLASSTSPDVIKTRIAKQRSILARTTKDLEQRRAALQARLRDEIAAVEAVLAPMQRRIDQLNELVWTVNLYLGRDEEIVTLLDGEPAPADTPITVRQMVLSMDEETMIAAGTGGIDFRDLDAFDHWVTDPDHLHQVLPEQRGVVVLVPRRRGRDYGDTFTNAALNAHNKQSYWLIRNGARLFRMSTDFAVGDLLTPGRHEFEEYFTEPRYHHGHGHTERVPLEPGSSAWLRAEEKAGARRRHYMRAALILQGLVDRTTVFAPLPAPDVSLLQPASYDAGHVQLICDADNTISTGRQPFHLWLTERNKELRPGMRIVGAFDSTAFTHMRSREQWNYHHHSRLRPGRAENPVAGTIYTIESRADSGGLVIRYERTEDVQTRDEWGHIEYRRPKTRATCVIYPTDTFVLPVDLATVEEMRDYLQARTERHAYLDMVPLLRTAVETKETEAAAEEPFLRMLAGEIIRVHEDVDVADALAAASELTSWWKHTTVHYRPLVAADDPTTARRAIAAIVAEFGARRRAEATVENEGDHNARIIAQLRAQIPDIMLVARTRDGGYIALEPQPRRHPEPLAARGVYVREHRTGKLASAITSRDWIVSTRRRASLWTALWTSPAWDTWNLSARRADHLTDPEIDTLLDTLRAYGANHHTETRDYATGSRTYKPSGVPALITSEKGDDGRPALRLYLNPPTTFTAPDRILSERIPDVDMPTLRLTWRRGKTAVEHTISAHVSYVSWQQGHHRGDDTLLPPWRDDPIVWSDPDQLAHARFQAEARNEVLRERAALNEHVHTFRNAVAAAWESRAEQAAYASFIDDYRDPDLWEGHRKTITNKLRYPHHGAHWNDGLTRLLERLVEDGHDPTGHDVGAAAAILGEDITLPDDILDLPIAP